jgi:phage gpG-like protein
MDGFRIDVDTAPVDGLLGRLRERLDDLTPAMERIGMVLVGGILRNFDQGRAPDGGSWPPSGRVKREGGQTLVKTGMLRNSIVYEAHPGSVEVGPSGPALAYAAIHQFGGHTGPHVIEARDAKALAFMAGGGLIFRRLVHHPGSNIPARQYLGVRDEDWPVIEEVLLRFLEGLYVS